ncbi:MAG: hypothetical protein OEM67_00935 [Thermoleophilia bacterium]|nr:hypothetical protein [Thermoleophilia bacterium]
MRKTMAHQPQIGWQDERTATGRARQTEVSLEWVMCGWCWGQRVLVDPGRGSRPCPNCLGVGQIARATDLDFEA